MKLPKTKCKKCGYEQQINPYYDDWFCNNCKTHWGYAFPELNDSIK